VYPVNEVTMTQQEDNTTIMDPTPELAPTARRILDAGVRVLDCEGFAGLTFERIANEAGENGALIRYHFGSKAGLIRAIVDAVLFSQARGLVRMLTPLAPGAERRDALLKRQREVAKDVTTFRRMFEVIPYALRDPVLCPKFRELMQWYRTLDAWVFGTERPDEEERARLEPLSMLSAAVLDGIALQVQADPDLDVDPAIDLWQRMLLTYLESTRRCPSS
jgi:AcrR family transcriptional regulator